MLWMIEFLSGGTEVLLNMALVFAIPLAGGSRVTLLPAECRRGTADMFSEFATEGFELLGTLVIASIGLLDLIGIDRL